MYQRDFILRMIEDFFRFLKIILKLKEDKQYGQALDMINETAQKLLKLDINEVSSKEEVFENLFESTALSLEQMEILAGLLKTKAEIHQECSEIFSAINAYEKALRIYTFCQEHSKNYSMDRVNKISEIRIILDQLFARG